VVVSLKESFEFMCDEPKVFLPRVFTTILWSFFMIYYVKVLTRFSIDFMGSFDPLIVLDYAQDFQFLIVVILFLELLDVVVSGIYPSLVNQLKKKEKVSFSKALHSMKKSIPTLLLVSGFMIVLAFLLIFSVFSLIFYLFSFSDVLFGFTVSLVVVLCSMILLVVFYVFFYFSFPIAVLEKKGFVSTVLSSWSSGKQNFPLVFAMFVVSMISASIVSFSEITIQTNPDIALVAQVIGVIGFLISRVINLLSVTYNSVLNTDVYLNVLNE
ncbi:MAG: hypothetical protein KAS30_00825, partial [Candidatus Diapherotrites archaeon]|nr:hypothetical protein [Candidatus Diapherotrites archaeon]